MILATVLLGSVIAGAVGVYVVKLWSGGSNSKKSYPFSSWKDVPPPKPLVLDQKLRDPVLKEGFKVEKVPEGLDAIVIGSGAGGLSTAALLAKTGWKVLVLEQHDQAGGCCHTFIEKGFEFDVGIHYIGKMLGNTEFRCLVDQVTNGQMEWIPMDNIFDEVFIGTPGKHRVYPIPTGAEAIRSSLLKQFPKEAEGIDYFLEEIDKARRQSVLMCVPKILPMWLAKIVVKTGIIHLITSFFRLSTRSVQDVISTATHNKELQAVMAYCFGDYGMIPSKAPFTMHAMLWNHFFQGAAYPYGGASEFAFHSIPVIEKSGGKVLVRANVKDILVDDSGKAYGVSVEKGNVKYEIRAPVIISAAGAINTFAKMLPRSLAEKSRYWKYLQEIGSGQAAISMFIGLDGNAKELQLKSRNCWTFVDSDVDKLCTNYMKTKAEDVTSAPVPMLFISFPSTKDPSWEKRFPGKSVCTVVTLTNFEWFKEWDNNKVKKRGEEYERFKQELSHIIWEQILKYFPQLEGKDMYMELGSPVSNNYYLGSTAGEIYGLDHSIKRFTPECVMDLRPKTDIPNLYLSGQDVMGCGFSGAMYGGLLCASELLGRNLFMDLVTIRKEKGEFLQGKLE